ncbi:PD-(D/E)XK nuclease family transposase [Xiamenia xianingshaonis]|uniref:PD-(D/E)XK nuclease family transposase n=1 Tax=Xiamenia xianingshaonis TaxID=2682776 RepID=A0A9E6SUJ9_9ACTN|nr:PD-(D/E)XK nuclease family transposase [Xiamenia xianingshaonis]NHM13342.1 hypothetical protein [Xiamenia xianingshaonis]QTU84578.1 PD-(D/E)XK nuclease family transposase [Xiamenia xianingshaonis]
MRTRTADGRSLLTNSFAFADIMARNEDVCRGVIERVLGVKVERLSNIRTETGQVQAVGKSIRCDVLAEGPQGAFAVEMQVAREPSLPRRARYYRSLVNARLLPRGGHYSELPDLCLIFICLYDPLGLGLPRYTARMRVEEDLSFAYDNGEQEVIVNAAGDLSLAPPGLATFLDYLLREGAAESDPFLRHVDDILEEALQDEEWRSQVISFEQYVEFERGNAYDLGREEGMARGREEALDGLVAAGLLSQEQAQEFLADMARAHRPSAGARPGGAELWSQPKEA